MANTILKGNQVILRCSNLIMANLHEQLKKIIQAQNIKNIVIRDTLDKLDQEIQGLGFAQFDIKEQFKDKSLSENSSHLVKP